MEKVFFISMESLLPTLFWGNIISLLFLCVYHSKNKFTKDKHIAVFLIIARLSHALYYFVASGRGLLPDWLSVNLGNTMLFVGFYFEAQGIMRLIKKNTKFSDRLLLTILAAAAAIFNAIEFIAPVGGIRITVASLGVVAIMALPNSRMLLSRDSSTYMKLAAVFYSVFLLLLLVRAGYSLQHRDMGILTTNIVQSVTFLSLLLQIMIALPSYALIIKGYVDDELRMMATTDRLTGLFNRHAFLSSADAIYKSGKRFQSPLSVLFMDVDHFKMVNDRYGHIFGDQVLVRLAVLINKCLRESDLTCRFGGEEFVALLPHTGGAAAQIAAERIMNEVRKARFDEQPDFSFSVSIGISSGVPHSGQTLDDAARAADEAMYAAKRAGRNRIVARDM